ncbi:MAG TPA: energy-coupling factor transporter transmembrane protein EcfT, partial [Firmicutes bacterium]|nr:energy-coupling factor transporter transmembrane protein EcfT [Bacillota bacterium]
MLLSAGGLLAALAALLRITVILAAVLLLTLKDYQQMVTGLAQIRVPYELAYMVLLAVRFIPVLMEEFRNSLVAIELRG